MARTGSMLGVIASAAMLAACSGSGEAAPETTLDVPTTVAATEPDPTTTIAPSTQAPTTTIDPATALAEEVEADLLEADRLENEASQDPFNLEKEAAALARRVGFAADALRAKLVDYRQRNVAVRENPKVAPSLTIELPVTIAAGSSDVAEVQVCEVNSWVLVEVGAGPNGTDAVVDPEVITSRGIVFLRKVDGVWAVEGGSRMAEWPGATACPAE